MPGPAPVQPGSCMRVPPARTSCEAEGMGDMATPLLMANSGAVEGSAPGRWCGEAQCWQYRLRFVGISDDGIEIAEERGKREAKSLEGVKQNAKALKTMESFHEWLYTKHGAYAAAVKVERLPPSERKIYNG
eukprot:292574-Hanusia_phi.AAC.4